MTAKKKNPCKQPCECEPCESGYTPTSADECYLQSLNNHHPQMKWRILGALDFLGVACDCDIVIRVRRVCPPNDLGIGWQGLKWIWSARFENPPRVLDLFGQHHDHPERAVDNLLAKVAMASRTSNRYLQAFGL